MVASLVGVAMVAQPPFLFGGQGLNKLGLLLATMQVGLIEHFATYWSRACT